MPTCKIATRIFGIISRIISNIREQISDLTGFFQRRLPGEFELIQNLSRLNNVRAIINIDDIAECLEQMRALTEDIRATEIMNDLEGDLGLLESSLNDILEGGITEQDQVFLLKTIILLNAESLCGGMATRRCITSYMQRPRSLIHFFAHGTGLGKWL